MKEAPRSAFNFEKYIITKFSFQDLDRGKETISIRFDPSGTYFQREGRFEMIFEFVAFESTEPEKEMIKATVEASFKFADAILFEEIPTYFYKNSIAIVFPYLRAFISTLTLQANTKALILPVLNLSDLEEPFKEKTTVVTN